MSTFTDFVQDLVTQGLERYGRYYSKYRGFVVDRDDPLNLNRIKVVVPTVLGNHKFDQWAYPSNYSGKDHGMQCIPSKGDLVWIEFEKGNPRFPLWTYAHFTKEQNEVSDKDIYYFKTPKGNLVEIDDTNNHIRITRSGGKIIEITDKISLGKSEKSDEPAVLGDTTQKLLEELYDIISKGKVLTQMGPQPFMSDTQLKLAEWKEKIKDIKSETITLDK